MPAMKCAVTGGTGFIGAELRRQLAARGAEALSVSRRLIPAAELRGIHTLFHCAGLAHRHAPAAVHEQANCAAALAQARAARDAGIRQFVFLSSAKANPEGDAYSRAKWRAEAGLAEIAGAASATAAAHSAAAPSTAHAPPPTPSSAGSTGLPVVILRPALVYGPGVKANLRRLMRAVRAGLPAPPPIGARSLVAAEDLCAAMCRLLDAPQAGYRCFHVTDGEIYHLQRIHAAFRRALGREPGRCFLPAPVWRAACALYDAAAGGRGTWQALSAGEIYSNRPLREALDWRPARTLEDAAAAMLAALPE